MSNLSIEPTVEDLLLLSSQGPKKRLFAAKQVKYLSPDVDLDKLMQVIRMLSTDPESLEYSELAVSLASLIESMSEEKAIDLLERLMEEKNTKSLVGMILGITKIPLDKDFIGEAIRRLIIDPSEDVRNTGLSALRNYLDYLGKNFLIDLISDLFISDNANMKEVALVLMSIFRDKISINVLVDFLLRGIEEDESLGLKILEMINSETFGKLPRKAVKEILAKAVNYGTEKVQKKAIELARKHGIQIS